MEVILNGHTITTDSSIEFTTYNQYDAGRVWAGRVVGMTRYAVASKLDDIEKYNVEVEKSPTGPSTILLEDEIYIILELKSDATVGEQKAFAVSWINEGSVNVIETNNTFDVRILDAPVTAIATVLQLLQDNGFRAKLK